MFSLGQVEDSAEFQRIKNLPRRTEPPAATERLSEALCRTSGEFRPVQAQALAEIHCCRGLLAPITVGGGKTLVTFLAPVMVGAKRPLLLVPAKLREKTHWDFAALSKEWRGGAKIEVVSYELLSRAEHAAFVDKYAPDMIIADECHKLKNIRAAVTRRVGRYLDAHPEVVFVGLSGTVTKRSLLDFAHLAEWALHEGAPVPLEVYDLECWAQVLDEESQWFGARRSPGVLQEFANEGEEVRLAYNRRLAETPGVVVSTTEDVDASLNIVEWKHRPVCKRLVENLYETWEKPDGAPLISAAEVWQYARELSQGFWYYWSPDAPEEWIEARREWASFVRGILARSRTLDTELQVRLKYEDDPRYQAWKAIKDQYEYSVVVQWEDTAVVDAAVNWAWEKQGIVWVEHRAVGEALEERGVPYYGNLGLRNGQPIEAATGAVAASIAANSEGRNLQHYSNNLVLSPPTTGDQWEQLLGRTHRQGQKADEVSVEVFLGCDASRTGFMQALSDARYQNKILGSPQKLILATIGIGKLS